MQSLISEKKLLTAGSLSQAKGKRINCFELLSRNHDFVFETTAQKIMADFVVELLD